MTITDNVTTFTVLGTQFDAFFDIPKDEKEVAGGDIKEKFAGRRFVAEEDIRITETEWNTLSTLLTNQAEAYYYTPTVTPGFLTDDFFPMQVAITTPKKSRQVGGGQKRFYVGLRFKSVGYV